MNGLNKATYMRVHVFNSYLLLGKIYGTGGTFKIVNTARTGVEYFTGKIKVGD